MLKKCLKYDLRHVWRVWWIMAVSVLGLGVIGSLAFRVFLHGVQTSDDNVSALYVLGYIFCMLIFIAAVFGIVAFLLATTLLCYYRFYKNFYSDEGYLTFTLPVRRRTLYLSKTLNTVIWTAASIGVIALVCFIFLCLFPVKATNGGIYIPGTASLGISMLRGLGHILSSAWQNIGAWLLVYILEGLLLVALLQLFQVGLIQLCITIGAVIAKKNKLLAAVGIYYLINWIFTGVLQLIVLFSVSSMSAGFFELISRFSGEHQHLILSLLALLICVIIATLDILIHFFTLEKMERKLNLP